MSTTGYNNFKTKFSEMDMINSSAGHSTVMMGGG